MKPWSELTDAGRVRRLHTVARAALDHHDLDVIRLRCIATDTNTIFRVDTADGSKFALRVQTDPEDTDVHTPTEVAWLFDLAGVEGIDAVRVIPTRTGAGFITIDLEGVPGPRDCVLFSWVPGRPIGDDATTSDYHALGVLAARLHDHAEGWQMPADLHPLVWDRVFYYPTEPVVLYEDRYAEHLTPDRRQVVEAVEQRAAAELARLHRERAPIIVHGDLHPWNVHSHRGRLVVFDFEDLMVAAPVQDIAITLFYNRDHERYDELCAAYREGYETLRAWPVEWDGQLELLMGARTVSFINYVLRLDEDPAHWIPRFASRLERLL
jgi:Ser/Thr protein kinase RdoA (MazF antagonist)